MDQSRFRGRQPAPMSTDGKVAVIKTTTNTFRSSSTLRGTSSMLRSSSGGSTLAASQQAPWPVSHYAHSQAVTTIAARQRGGNTRMEVAAIKMLEQERAAQANDARSERSRIST